MAESILEFRLAPRSRQILTAAIELYIETGEPVSSQTLAQLEWNRDGLSSATIRNVMAELGEQGLLEQPHTSAGRIPTARAFRYYAQQSMGGTAVLTGETRARLDGDLSGIHNTNEFLERTSRVLASLSGGVGLTMRSSGSAVEDDALEHVHFQKLPTGQVMAIVVMRSGTVRDRLLSLDRDLTTLDLDTSARYLNENFRGFTLERVRKELAVRLETERSEYDRLMQSLRQISQTGVFQQVAAPPEVYIEGVSNLVVGQHDRERLRQLLAALEEKQRLVTLLNAYINSQSEAVQIVVGLEDALPEMRNLVLVATPARVGGEHMGAMAVIGSTRIRYEHTAGAVQYAAQLFEKLLQPHDETQKPM